MKKGFSLVELLIVSAIIMIVSLIGIGGFSSARAGARDDRRVADLRQVSQALELFFTKCGFYPGSYNTAQNKCQGGLLNGKEASENPDNWGELGVALKDARIGFDSIPNDPKNSQTYAYWAQLGSQGVTPRGSCYVLWADMETNHTSLNDPKELDNSDIAAVQNLYPPTLPNCDGLRYCTGNIECFFDI